MSSFMTSTPLFQKQQDHKHILQALLIALSFTSPLQPRYIQSIVNGFVHNSQFYVSNQKIRGWLNKQDRVMYLSEKATEMVQSCPFERIVNKKEVAKFIDHETLLVRSLFLCLLHLNFADIKQIRKQKYYESRYIPDLTIITKTSTLFIEVDTGNQPVQTLESKIRGFQAHSQEATLIYFTDSDKTYSYFAQSPGVQFIYLSSTTLSQDIEKLTAINPHIAAINSPPSPSFVSTDVEEPADFFPHPPHRKAIYKLADNVFVFDKSLVKETDNPSSTPLNSEADYEKSREEVIKLLYEDGEY
jgi:hypothetical protein